MKTLVAVDNWILGQILCPFYPFCWFQDHGPHHKAFGRDDGLVYVAGFKTREAADTWAAKEAITP